MLKIIYTSSDADLARRIIDDFTAAGYAVAEGSPVRGDVALVLLSPAALADRALRDRLDAALDLSLHVVPGLTESVPLPDLIANLTAVDLSDGYDFSVIRSQVDAESSPSAGLTMRALTPKVRRSNRGVGLFLGILALIMFGAGIYLVGVMGIQAPVEEFNSVDTMVALTRDIIAAPELEIYAEFLPRTTAEAENYVATIRAVPSPYRPLVAQTATAVAEQVAAATPAPGD